VNIVLTHVRERAGAANVERVKTAWRAELVNTIEDLLGRARTLAYRYFIPDYFAEDLTRHGAGMAESLQQVAVRWLDSHRRVDTSVLVVGPAAKIAEQLKEVGHHSA
jgi:hypothetical protein